MGIDVVAKNHLQPPKTMFLPQKVSENYDQKTPNSLYGLIFLMTYAFHLYGLIFYMYSYVICMSVVFTRMSSVCHLYALVCHSYVLVCHLYVTRMWFYHEPILNLKKI